MTGYTKEQVQEALKSSEAAKVYDNANKLTRFEFDTLVWAASQFLAALPVIEWYGEMNSHGQKAREYLEKLNQNKE